MTFKDLQDLGNLKESNEVFFKERIKGLTEFWFLSFLYTMQLQECYSVVESALQVRLQNRIDIAVKG